MGDESKDDRKETPDEKKVRLRNAERSEKYHMEIDKKNKGEENKAKAIRKQKRMELEQEKMREEKKVQQKSWSWS